MLSIDEAIAHAREVANTQKGKSGIRLQNGLECEHFSDCLKCAEEHKQIAEWLEELKALRLLLDWAIECDFGLDSFPEEYAKYKHTLTDDMTYKDMIIQIAKCVVAEQLKTGVENDNRC